MQPHVVILGAGFGGITAAQSLAHADVRVTIVDRRNHHLFQPLLYQVAMAGLSPADIASPVRSVLKRQENATVLLAEVTSVDLENKRLVLDEGTLDYDFLIYAAGAQNFYFGHPEWEKHAPGLKSVEDALEIRRRVLLAFEEAERCEDEALRDKLLTFVVIGGGPTGVELAGAVAELSHHVLAREFRRIDPDRAHVILVEAGNRVLPTFSENLSTRAVDQLSDLGVDVQMGERVVKIDEDGVVIVKDGVEERIHASTVVWGAGVAPVPLAKTMGVPLDRAGRVIVNPDCSIDGHPEAFAIGDAAAFNHTEDGKPLPGVSPVAMQQARYVAKLITRRHRSEQKPFEYFDKGSMATIGRKRAIAAAFGLEMTGFLAWLAWLFVHLVYLIGFRNRIAVLLQWAYSYVTYRRGARLITGHWDGEVTRDASAASRGTRRTNGASSAASGSSGSRPGSRPDGQVHPSP
jgi:NADH dehydrogenase